MSTPLSQKRKSSLAARTPSPNIEKKSVVVDIPEIRKQIKERDDYSTLIIVASIISLLGLAILLYCLL